jgi:hypothetical protein
MRTLSDTLLAAQKKSDRLPYIEARVYDYEAGIKRLTWTRLYTGSEPDNHHGTAFDGEGSMHRIRAAAGNKLYHQKVASPGPGADFSQWTQIGTDCAGPCAVAACGARLYIFYRTTTNLLWKYYSHDYGQTWDNAQLASYADVLSMAAAWCVGPDPDSPTPIVVCFALKSNQINAIVLDTGTQSATEHTWSDGNHPLLNTYGVGATYNASLDQCEVVLAGKESNSPYNHCDLFRTKFSSAYNFLALESFLMSPVATVPWPLNPMKLLVSPPLRNSPGRPPTFAPSPATWSKAHTGAILPSPSPSPSSMSPPPMGCGSRVPALTGGSLCRVGSGELPGQRDLP